MAENISKEERIGYHKGAINTLIGERNELMKMLNTTEGLIRAHAAELEKLGVKLQQSEQKQE
jgi:hypothetical protein